MSDLLALATSSFELVEDSGPDEEGQSDVVDDASGQFLQENTVKSTLKYTHKYVVKIKADALVAAANRPVRGLRTGLSSVKYFIDDVKVNDKTKHWTLAVSFHRFLDVAATNQQAVAADLS
jgi:hypothetical protein